jgi:tungstate transport system substrate-binding protein
MELWAKAGLKPAGPGYQIFERGSEGNSPTLLYTDQKEAYTVIDRATYLGLRHRIRLAILVEGDEALLNHISLIPVNPAKFPRVNHRDALTFVAWLTDPDKGQKLIATFGQDKFGAPLFTPEGRAPKTSNRK